MKRPWTKNELNLLKKRYAEKGAKYVAKKTGHPFTSVIAKARQLNILVPAPKKWSDEDLKLLKELWTDKKYSIDEVAAKLGKTRAAAHYQAWHMGLRRPQVWKFWNKDEVSYLKKNYKKKTYEAIAKDLGMTRISVFQKARKMGLRLRGKPQPWTQEHDDYIRQNYKKIPTRDIAEKLGRSLDSVINRAGPLGISDRTRRYKAKA